VEDVANRVIRWAKLERPGGVALNRRATGKVGQLGPFVTRSSKRLGRRFRYQEKTFIAKADDTWFTQSMTASIMGQMSTLIRSSTLPMSKAFVLKG
jgi:hypothetical protein